MTTLASLAKLIRSKNAGPFELTFDILFDSEQVYNRVKASGAITVDSIAGLYNLPAERVQLFFCDNALAIKATIPRPYAQGDLRDGDCYGGQQYAPLMDIEVDSIREYDRLGESSVPL
jgi:hypothetical protein